MPTSLTVALRILMEQQSLRVFDPQQFHGDNIALFGLIFCSSDQAKNPAGWESWKRCDMKLRLAGSPPGGDKGRALVSPGRRTTEPNAIR